jgi:hypothetical protein
MKNLKYFSLKMKNLREICKSSSLPCISKILSSDNYFLKLIWSLSLIGLTSLSVYYVAKNLTNYLSFSFVTNIAIISETTQPQFPTISFCISSNIELPKLHESIYDCSFEKNKCNYKDFEISTVNLVNANYFETCIRFNSGRNYHNQPTEIKTISRTNIYAGLNVTFLLDNFIIDSFQTTTIYKLRISIDNYTSYFNRLQVYDSKSGIDIPLGNTQIKIEREYYQKLAEPYNNCVKQDTSEYISFLFQYYFKQINKTYRQKDCFDLCIVEFMNTKCNCTDELVQNCYNDANTAGCMHDLYFQFLNKQIQMPDKCLTLCPIECDSINYKIEQNSFQIPNNFSVNQLDLNKYVNILINYQNNQYTLISQSPKMQLFDLISSVGGLISLFLGFSFLTLIEFIDVIFKFFFHFLKKNVNVAVIPTQK